MQMFISYTNLCLMYCTGFSGQRCEINIDDCANTTCGSEGQCVDGVQQSFCQCAVDKFGSQCEKGRCKLPYLAC